MKKISIMASLLLFGSMLNADIPIKTGWQLLGATEDINTTMFKNTCINYMWKYDTTDALNPAWRVHIANGADYTHSYATMATLAKGEGYWVFGNADCVVETSSSSSSTSSVYFPTSTSSSVSSSSSSINNNGSDLPSYR